MAAFNSTYHTSNYYRYGALSPTIDNNIPYDLSTTKQSLLSNRLLSPLYNSRTKPLVNQYDSLNDINHDPLYDDFLGNDTDRLLNNRLKFLNNNSHPNNINNNTNQIPYSQQKPPRPKNINSKKNNSTFPRATYNPKINNNSAQSDDEVLTNKIDKRLSKIPINSFKQNRQNRGSNSNNNSSNNISAFERQQQKYGGGGDFDDYPQHKLTNFNVEILNQENANKNGRNRKEFNQRQQQKNKQAYQFQNENDENFQSQRNSQNSIIENNENNDDIDTSNNDERMFIYREIPKNNPNFTNNNNNNYNDNNDNIIVNNSKAPLNNKGNSADIDITTVSSMLSSENHSPEANKIEAHRQTPFSKPGSKFDPKRSDQNGIHSVASRENISTSYSTFRELDYSVNDQASQNRKFDPDRDSNISKIKYYKENTNETIYKRESLSRIKPIIVRGDVAYGKDAIITESNKQKSEKEMNRKSYAEYVKRRNNMLTLSDGRSTVNENEKRKKSSKFETRKVYSRLVKEINDDEYFQKEQNDVLKSILPQIEKRGEQLVKQKKQKLHKIKKKNQYSEYVKDRNQVLIEDQRKQRDIKAKVRRVQDFNERANQSYATKYGSDNDYAKAFKKQTYFIDLKEDTSGNPVYENDFDYENDFYTAVNTANNSYSQSYKSNYRK